MGTGLHFALDLPGLSSHILLYLIVILNSTTSKSDERHSRANEPFSKGKLQPTRLGA